MESEVINASILQQAVVPAYVELFQIDLTDIITETPSVFYLTNQSVEITWGGNTYSSFPIKISEIEQSTTGAPPRPKLEIANIYQNRLFGTLAFKYNDIIGGKIVYIRTLETYLTITSHSVCASPMKFEIFKKESHTKDYLSFSLRSPLDRERAFLPKRQMLKNEFPGLGQYKRL